MSGAIKRGGDSVGHAQAFQQGKLRLSPLGRGGAPALAACDEGRRPCRMPDAIHQYGVALHNVRHCAVVVCLRSSRPACDAMSAPNAIDFLARRLAGLDLEIKTCRAAINDLQRDPKRVLHLLELLEKRNRALRQLQRFQRTG